MDSNRLHFAFAALFFLACGDDSLPATSDGGLDATGIDSGSDSGGADAADDTVTPNDGGGDAVPTTDGGFDPLSIPGLAVWLRADKVTTNATGVVVWPDRSPNHDDFVPSGGNPPVIASAIHGQPAVDMTTINLFTGHATTVGTGPVLAEIVAAAVGTGSMAFDAVSANNNSLVIGTSSNGNGRAWEAALGNPVATASSSTAINGAWHILAVQIDVANAISLRINGTLAGGPTAGATLDLGKLDTTNIGGSVVAELVVVVGAISTGNLDSLESYLKARYAL